MSASSSTAPPTPTSLSSHNSRASPRNNSNKPRLTEEEKKLNHIASENKRRLAIREQFDRLAAMTPEMGGRGRSEGQVLSRLVPYIREQLEERKRLIREIENRGGVVAEVDRVF